MLIYNMVPSLYVAGLYYLVHWAFQKSTKDFWSSALNAKFDCVLWSSMSKEEVMH